MDVRIRYGVQSSTVWLHVATIRNGCSYTMQYCTRIRAITSYDIGVPTIRTGTRTIIVLVGPRQRRVP